MCRFKSGIILKNKVVLALEGNESHSSLLESIGIKDDYLNASKTFVRSELIPIDSNKASDVKGWKYVVDQDITPDWYNEDPKKHENEFRTAVEEWIKEKFVILCGRAWKPIKTDEKGTYYLLDELLENSEFGKTNNYATSYIREKLNESNLAKELKKEFGDRLVPVTTNLLSLDGLKDYGTVEGDILSIPTIDLYRECRENITNLDSWWWLATPDSTPSGYGDDCVRCVGSGGSVCYYDYDYDRGVRPVLILKS